MRQARREWENHGGQVVTADQITAAKGQMDGIRTELRRLQTPEYESALTEEDRLSRMARLASLCLIPFLGWLPVSLSLASITAIGTVVILIACSVGLKGVLIGVAFTYLGVFGVAAVVFFDLERSSSAERLAELQAYLKGQEQLLGPARQQLRQWQDYCQRLANDRAAWQRFQAANKEYERVEQFLASHRYQLLNSDWLVAGYSVRTVFGRCVPVTRVRSPNNAGLGRSRYRLDRNGQRSPDSSASEGVRESRRK